MKSGALLRPVLSTGDGRSSRIEISSTRSRWDAWSTSAHRVPCQYCSEHHQRHWRLTGGFPTPRLRPGRWPRQASHTPRSWLLISGGSDSCPTQTGRLLPPQASMLSEPRRGEMEPAARREGMSVRPNELLRFRNAIALDHIRRWISTIPADASDRPQNRKFYYQSHYTTGYLGQSVAAVTPRCDLVTSGCDFLTGIAVCRKD